MLKVFSEKEKKSMKDGRDTITCAAIGVIEVNERKINWHSFTRKNSKLTLTHLQC